MGARLVSTVLTRWTNVSDRAFRILVRMAVTALDDPRQGKPAAVYFGGRDLLAMTLKDGPGTTESRYRTVKRALAELCKAGAIERTAAGRTGQNTVYRLTLGQAAAIEDDERSDGLQGDTHSPPEGDTSGHPEGDTRSPFRGTPAVPPRNQEEPLEELLEERRGDLQTASHPSRVRAAEPKPPSVVVEIFPGASKRPPVGGRRWSDAAMEAVAEASARVAKRKADHQAQQESS